MPMLTPGTPLYIDKVQYTVDRHLDGGDIALTQNRLMRPMTLTQQEFNKGFYKGTISFVDPSEAEKPAFKRELAAFFAVSPKEQDYAAKTLPYLQAGHALGARPSRASVKEALDAVAKKHGHKRAISLAKFYRLLPKWLVADRDIRALVRGTYKRGKRTKRLRAEVHQIIFSFIKSHFLSRQPRLTVKDVHDAILVEIRRINAVRPSNDQLPEPSRATVQRATRDVDTYTYYFTRFGKKKADQMLRRYGIGPSCEMPLGRVEMDHTVLDIILVDESGVILGRPTLTVAIDFHSRMVLGIYIGFEPPSRMAVNNCLRDVLSPKDYLEQIRTDIKTTAPFGIPKDLIVDNGKEFHSFLLETVCLSLDISIDNMPVAQPHYKGVVESFNKTIQQAVIHKLPGTTYGSIEARAEEDAKKHACMTLTQVIGAVWAHILNVYVHTVHEALGDTPMNVWVRGTEKYPPRYPKSIEDLNPLQGGIDFRKVDGKGVKIFGLIYNGENVERFLNRLDGPEKYEIHFNPANISKISVLDDRDHKLYDLPAVKQEYTKNLSLYEHNKVKAGLREKKKEIEAGNNLEEERAALNEQYRRDWDQSRKRGKTLGKAQARAQGVGTTHQSDENYRASLPAYTPPSPILVSKPTSLPASEPEPILTAFDDAFAEQEIEKLLNDPNHVSNKGLL